MPRGGKRVGAGRKKSAAAQIKSGYFSARCSKELRKRLQGKAKHNNRSLAREIELRLEKTLVEDDRLDLWGDKQNATIARLIRTLAQYVNATARGHWRSSRFSFECLREAVHHTMRQLSYFVPEEPKDAPPELKQNTLPEDERMWLDPVQLGRFVALAVFSQLREQRPPISSNVPYPLHDLSGIGEDLEISKGWEKDVNEFNRAVVPQQQNK